LLALVGVFLLAPGLGDARDLLVRAKPGWLVLAVVPEGLSFASYLVMFGPIFCTGLTRNRSWQIGGSELAMGSLVPASGAGGLALGGALPLPGGIGGIDLGLIGTLIVYGTPAAATAAAVLAHRIILFWLPLIVGGVAFAGLRRDMPGTDEFAACAPAIAVQSA
jgi:hypothetical protein